MNVSVNKYISDSGFCSRREADKIIEQARVSINGNVVLKGARVQEGDVVEVDGEPIRKKKRAVYIAFNKPKGVTCTTDRNDRTNIIDFINYKSRIFPVGRLDKLSDGLIFLTNDGDIVNKILRAGNHHEKEYVVNVDKPVTAEFIHQLRNGVRISPGALTKKCIASKEGPKRFRITLQQGLNRQIRRMCEALGYRVETLTRVRIMHISLRGIAPGTWRYFTAQEISEMEELLKHSVKGEEGSWEE